MKKTRTKGNVIIEDIKLGDIHYEYDYGCYIKCEVIKLPFINEEGNWEWQSKCVLSGNIIDYMVNPDAPPHYSLNLYNYQAYMGFTQIKTKKT